MHPLAKPCVLNYQDYQALLKPRAHDAHKGDFGKVLIIGGNEGYAGSVRLAGEAALRCGAGVVILATHHLHAHYLQATRPELIVYGIKNKTSLVPLLEDVSVVVIGPGLGKTAWSKELIGTTLLIKDKPILIDADALNLLPSCEYSSQNNHIYTPHPGEAARLLGSNTKEIQQNRLDCLNKLNEKYAGICVLKGSKSLISQKNAPVYICKHGNPGMATAGMGDVLTGVIAALIAQKIGLMEATCLGVLMHALAGDKAAIKGQRGLIASDLFPHFLPLLNPAL